MFGMSLSIEEYIEIQKQNALEKGREEGREEGRAEGETRAQKKIVCRLKRKGLTEQAISEMLDMPVEDVKDLLLEE